MEPVTMLQYICIILTPAYKFFVNTFVTLIATSKLNVKQNLD